MLENDIDIKIEKSNKSRKNKKSCITFAKLNKYFLFPILCPLFNMISNKYNSIKNCKKGIYLYNF